MSNYLKITLLAFFFSFLFVRVFTAAEVVIPPYYADDGGYFSWTEALFKYGSFDWCKGPLLDQDLTHSCEGRTSASGMPYNKYPPGPAILLLPFNLIGAVVGGGPADRFFIWSLIGTFFLFLFGSLLLYDLTIRLVKDPRISFWTTVFFLTGNSVLYFVFRRPFMAHAAEFFLFFLAANLITRDYLKGPAWRSFLWLGLIAGLNLITRFSAFYMVGMLPICSLYFQQSKSGTFVLDRRFFRSLAIYGLGFAVLFAFFLYTNYVQKGTWLFSPSGYDEGASPINYFFGSPRNYVRIPGFFVGPHTGGYLLMPFLAFEAVLILSRFKKIAADAPKHRLLVGALLLGSIAQLIFMANHPTNGMSYGNRYLLNTFYVCHVAFVFIVARYGLPAFSRKIFVPLGLALSFIAAMNIVNFESTPDLRVIPGKSRDEGVVDPYWNQRDTLILSHYALNSVKHTLSGKALVSFGVSPLAAYPLFLFKDRLRGIGALSKAYDYYESPYRKVYSLRDLRVLFYYQAAIFILILLGVIAVWLPRKLSRRRVRHHA